MANTNNFLTQLHNCTRKKPNTLFTNLYLLTFATFLCTLFYFLGLWRHYPTTTAAAIAAVAESSSLCFHPNTTATTQSSTNLDFAAHHLLPDLPPTVARGPYLPPCASPFSEHTPCEDQQRSLSFPRHRLAYRERHCPAPEERLRCRIPAPYGYRQPLRWPASRDAAWYANAPHKELTVEKKGQNWVRFDGNRFRFPGGGTMFPRGADQYINDIGKLINLRDGSVRTAIDTGCGVASFGAYLLSRDILTMSFAPRDTHISQVQFALERGIPALIGILATIRLPYPSRAFDMAHCSRCLIPWGQYDGVYLTEIDRVLRPGGYWILSGPPINYEKHWRGWERTHESLKEEQDGIEDVAKSLCWKKLVQKDDLAVWQKPTNHAHCKLKRKIFKSGSRPLCGEAQDPDTAWYTKLDTCLTPLPEVKNIKEVSGGGGLANWPNRLTSIPPRIRSESLEGITAEMFTENTKLWKKRLAYYKKLDHQLAERGRYRNLLDMNAYLGGFAAALVDDPVWVMNIVPVEAEINTLGVVYERGLIGTYQNWYAFLLLLGRTSVIY
ncbi:putative methyltransferase PMT15 isoform B [Glycine soja]|uniref:Methyltransferase n=1 Tax=Glycine soja TaxID=3848 RepID=A0A445JTX7_GLYSO|nr:putative methyltransferase PMT15 isoform B [Glycine soja]